jgi:hypothetical protein
VGEGPDDLLYWLRPGKQSGTSATTNYEGSDFLIVFSTNARPFEAERGYTKFTAYALLNHDGDFTAAAAAIDHGDPGLPHIPSLSQRLGFEFADEE